MTENIQRLLRHSSNALSDSTPRLIGECSAWAGDLAVELLDLLWARNGFFAFESALHVRPLSENPTELGIAQWNRLSLWRYSYQTLIQRELFFAEDIFGAQFCIADGAIYRFDPETAEKEFVGSSVDQWATALLDDSSGQSGWPLAHEWQTRFGPLAAGKRLVPKIPFILGGNYEVDNLYELDAVTAMQFYGSLAVQIHGMPDGAQVSIKIVE